MKPRLVTLKKVNCKVSKSALKSKKTALWDSLRHWYTNVKKPEDYYGGGNGCACCVYMNTRVEPHGLCDECCPIIAALNSFEGCTHPSLKYTWAGPREPEANEYFLDGLIKLYVQHYQEPVQCGDWLYYLK